MTPRNISAWIQEKSSTAITLIAGGLFVVFLVWVLPRQAQASGQARAGLDSPDRSFFYTPEDLYHMAQDYGPDGRADYIQERFTFDLLWPAVYTLFLSTSISWTFRRFPSDGDWLRTLNLVPVLGGIFDILENLSAAIVMGRFPARMDVLAWLATLFTPVKWVMIGVSVAFLAVGGGMLIWQKARGIINR